MPLVKNFLGKDMKNVDDVLDFLIKNTEWNTDYKIGRSLLGYGNTAQVSGWRRRVAFPSNKDLIKMCEASGMDLGEAVKAIENSRENERPLKQAGFGNVVFLSSLSLSSFGALTLLKMSALPYETLGALIVSTNFVYYVKSNGKIFIIKEVENKLSRFSHHELSYLIAANDIEIDQVSTHRNNESLIYANFRKS